MAQYRNKLGLFALVLGLLVSFTTPEFFGCNDSRGQVLSRTVDTYPFDGHRLTRG